MCRVVVATRPDSVVDKTDKKHIRERNDQPKQPSAPSLIAGKFHKLIQLKLFVNDHSMLCAHSRISSCMITTLETGKKLFR